MGAPRHIISTAIGSPNSQERFNVKLCWTVFLISYELNRHGKASTCVDKGSFRC